jgi:hypothetical protein
LALMADRARAINRPSSDHLRPSLSATGENWFWHTFRARFGVSRVGRMLLL